MKSLKIYLILGIVVISLSLFSLGCQDVIKNNLTPSNVSSVGQTPAVTSSLDNLTPPPDTSTSNVWTKVIWGSVGFVACLVIVFFVWFFISLRRDDDYRYDRGETNSWKKQANELSKNLKRVETEIEDLRKKYERYKNFESQIPIVENQYRNEIIKIENNFPNLSETDLKDLFSEPAKEYWALVERARALKCIRMFFENGDEKAQALKLQCIELIKEIKDEEPRLYDAFKMAISSATVDGIKALHPILLQIKSQAEKKPVSTELRNELASLEKSLESIRDYSYRLIPSRLIKFAYELIELPASEKENKLKEKTVREIMTLINKYLQL